MAYYIFQAYFASELCQSFNVLLSPYLCICGISLDSIHYNHSLRIYINWRHQYPGFNLKLKHELKGLNFQRHAPRWLCCQVWTLRHCNMSPQSVAAEPLKRNSSYSKKNYIGSSPSIGKFFLYVLNSQTLN